MEIWAPQEVNFNLVGDFSRIEGREELR